MYIYIYIYIYGVGPEISGNELREPCRRSEFDVNDDECSTIVFRNVWFVDIAWPRSAFRV